MNVDGSSFGGKSQLNNWKCKWNTSATIWFFVCLFALSVYFYVCARTHLHQYKYGLMKE